MTSFVEKQALESVITIVLLHTMDEDGFPIFIFFGAKANNLKKLENIKTIAQLEKLGKIIRTGYGLPKEADWHFMNSTYGIEQDKTTLFQINPAK